MIDNIILVGGFPRPIGGVTTFVRRLAASDKRIKEVVDIYRGDVKRVPIDYSGKYRKLDNKFFGFIYLFFKMIRYNHKYIHFNFSNLKSLMFFLLLPKYSSKWLLMLHHGVLKGDHFPNFLIRYLLHRFDYIFCINETQYKTYFLHGVCHSKLIKASSYIKPLAGIPDIKFKQNIDLYFSSKPTFIASGYPTPLYNFDWCIRFVSHRKEFQLALFIYGDGSEKKNILEQL